MIIKVILFYITIFLTNIFIKKKNYLRSTTGSSHQNFANISIPLSGGVFLAFPIVYFLYEAYTAIIMVFLLFFFLGIFSDLNIINSPKKRFFFQLIILIIFTFYTQLEVFPTRIFFIDNYLMGTFISFFFTAFCLMVLINGSNFIDGLNGLLLGYFLIIILILFKLNLFSLIDISTEAAFFIVLTISFILILNFCNQLFIGDNGAYSLSFLVGCLLIKIYNINDNISPYFIILLLWYPCFENLFSIIRKIIYKKNPLKPDNAHIHHYLFIFLKNKLNLNKLWANNFSSLIINSFNLVILYTGSLKPYYTILQVQLIVFSIFTYIIAYSFLRKLTLKNMK